MKPIAWYDPSSGAVSTNPNSHLFTPLAQVWLLDVNKEWVSLTEDEQYQLWQKWNDAGDGWGSFYESIEAALKEKNQ